MRFLLFSFSLILGISFKMLAQVISPDLAPPLKPKEFYVAGVSDEREADHSKWVYGVTFAKIAQFIERNVLKDQSLRPVIITVKELKLIETTALQSNTDGHILLHLSFDLQKSYGTEHLIDYNGGLHYTSRGDNSETIERNIQGLVKNGLTFFNDWVNANADHNRKLAKSVKISFTDYQDKIEGDTIYYNPGRPLTWADFQSHLKASSRFEAQVMPGIGYNQEAKIIKGVIKVNLAVKTYLPKSACWANYSGRDDYSLNHEQRHFDIVKIISEQFKQKILAGKLTPDTFEAFINMQYLDSYRDMDRMQNAYDQETNHGTNKSAQADWSERIDKDLTSYNIWKSK